MVVSMGIAKYPKTHHIGGSKFKFSNNRKKDLEELKRIRLFGEQGAELLVEEKMDGSQLGIFFKGPSEPVFYSRGSIVGANEEFSLAKNWVYSNIDKLWLLLGDRFILFGEWLYLKHTIFYDALPSYFMEYDIYDRKSARFLSTQARRVLLSGHEYMYSVRIIACQKFVNAEELENLVGASAFVSSDQVSKLVTNLESSKSTNTEKIIKETDVTGKMEGLYIKVEKDGFVQERFKYIRYDFLSKITSSNTHWRYREKVCNALKAY